MRSEVEAKVQVGPIPIQTAEDARMAWLREEINDKELDEILARFGHTKESTTLGGNLPRNIDRVDDAFRRSLPYEPEPEKSTLEQKLKALDAKTKAREAATKAGPSAKDVKVESTVKAVVDPNQPAKEAYEKEIEAAAKKGVFSPAEANAAKQTPARSAPAKKSSAAGPPVKKQAASQSK